MTSFQVVIPPHVGEAIRALHPDLKRSIREAIRAIAADPQCGAPLRRELDGLWKFRVRRFRIVYAIDRKTKTMGPRQSLYEELTAQLRKKESPDQDE